MRSFNMMTQFFNELCKKKKMMVTDGLKFEKIIRSNAALGRYVTAEVCS